jgi:hypothetical protein
LSKKALAENEYAIQLSEKTLAENECSIAGSRLETRQWTASFSATHRTLVL